MVTDGSGASCSPVRVPTIGLLLTWNQYDPAWWSKHDQVVLKEVACVAKEEDLRIQPAAEDHATCAQRAVGHQHGHAVNVVVHYLVEVEHLHRIGIDLGLPHVSNDQVFLIQPHSALWVVIAGLVYGANGVPQPLDGLAGGLGETKEATPKRVEDHVFQRDAVDAGVDGRRSPIWYAGDGRGFRLGLGRRRGWVC